MLKLLPKSKLLLFHQRRCWLTSTGPGGLLRPCVTILCLPDHCCFCSSVSSAGYAQIVKLVTEAQEQKAPIHRLADRYSVGFTIATILFAFAAWFLSKDPIDALAVLVVATPCPLILATPIAIMSGIDLAARHGIIVKSGATIEQLGEVDVAVFDKTGTLTLGIPIVTEILLQEEQQISEEAR
jgi:P-type E1-E2 ATPase